MNTLYTSFIFLISLWKGFCAKSDNNCIKIELVDNPSKYNIITVEENSDVSLTFSINTQACPQSAPQCILKLSAIEQGLYLDKCKIPFVNMTCQERTSQDSCSCLNTDIPRVQFRQSFNGSHYKVYLWRGIRCSDATLNEVELLRIVFVIVKTPLRPKQDVSSNIPKYLSRYKIITANEKSVVRLTFNISEDTCQNISKMCVIKLITYDTGLVTDICTALIDNGTCTDVDMNKSCACENSATGSVISYSGSVTFSESDYKIYFWNAIIGNSSETMKQEEIMFVIRESESKQDKTEEKLDSKCSCHDLLLIIVLSCCVFVGTTINVICLVRRRSRGVQVEIVGEFSRNKVITVEENTPINVTFYINNQACQNRQLHILKMSYDREHSSTEECIIELRRGMCSKKKSEQPCSCLNTDKAIVQFYKAFNESEYKVYYWTERANTVKLKEIIFLIRKPNIQKNCTANRNDTKHTEQYKGVCLSLIHIVIAGPSAAVVAAVIAVGIGCLVRERCKTTEVRASSQDVPATEVVEVSQPRGESKRREKRVKTNHV
ncbi:uncharacterized protein LOC112568210 isoform X2 [Pomacea canaliculata]|uniref:uncharacterized protein LOC112568210 isoform X2 n=1 Tax=Pomacea canaliculata TaxID=400727 RepID=UPI000D726670|nr:uncharacterized protein LOC112568210 isoform X2 [Pomacea canaliculata]